MFEELVDIIWTALQIDYNRGLLEIEIYFYQMASFPHGGL
jgi:hypothetical protein